MILGTHEESLENYRDSLDINRESLYKFAKQHAMALADLLFDLLGRKELTEELRLRRSLLPGRGG